MSADNGGEKRRASGEIFGCGTLTIVVFLSLLPFGLVLLFFASLFLVGMARDNSPVAGVPFFLLWLVMSFLATTLARRVAPRLTPLPLLAAIPACCYIVYFIAQPSAL